ncbi:hypothetical protein Tco_1336605 [Tanacetum coccineum]
MVLPNNQVSSSKSVLDDKAIKDSSSDSNFDKDLYHNNEKDIVNDVVIPQTPSEEIPKCQEHHRRSCSTTMDPRLSVNKEEATILGWSSLLMEYLCSSSQRYKPSIKEP